ncbi:type II secretion system protein [Deinococcus deserti]|uniref:Putative prepilin-like protein n=1 Tax=Deinococcus deserti (strain DSM 17065 / CIP 109153 / LMG 22923 / VCD115) TaxID=546414 RepID=C1CZZ7_DEIDV|nr:type II secretion system protein [Deinococcus deserti]ACO45249.1 putative prepilin-like protein [Deinococcus deserti VCD115]
MRDRTCGFSLVEVLVALAIFSVVSAAVLALFPSIFQLNSQTRADQSVTIAARHYLERVRTQYSTQSGFDAATLPAAPAADTLNNYTCTPAVSTRPIPALADGQIKRVTLSCSHASQPTLTFVLDFGRPL